MKKIVKVLTWTIGFLSMFLSGFTFINAIYYESFHLLRYDLKNGFADNRVYAAALFVLILLTIWGGWVYWQILFGKIHVSCTIRIKNKLLLAVLDENDGTDIRADRQIDLKLIMNTICIVVTAFCVSINIHAFRSGLLQGTWQRTKTVGHSFGAVNSDDYTGSLEAFEYNYALGRRTMEVDLILTTDNRLVLKHDWDEPKQEGISEADPPSEETFLNAKILDNYTPLSFAQLCDIMLEHPDLWIVTDTKSTEQEEIKRQFEVLTDTARQTGGEEILDRIIVQVYNEEMFNTVDRIYHFDNYIFTMYWRFDNDDWLGITRDVCRFCVNNGIETITIGTNRISPGMKDIADHYGRNVYIHTVNDMEAADQYFNMGVTGIYTDVITDKDLGE